MILDKIKAANKAAKAQSEMKKIMEGFFHTYEKGGVRIVIRGDRKIEKLEVNGDELKNVRDAVNDCLKDLEKKLEKKLQGPMTEQLKGLGLSL